MSDRDLDRRSTGEIAAAAKTAKKKGWSKNGSKKGIFGL
jgi:hypothetical protein